jgi:type I restriction enzyme S subunit
MGPVMLRCTKASTMMTNLVPGDFLSEKVNIPSIYEQRSIGHLFSTLENDIVLHQREC